MRMGQYWADISALLDLYPALKFTFVFLFGLCLGSFASAVAWRAPRNMPWAYERVEGRPQLSIWGWRAIRSICPSCGHTLGARDLVPVLSWLLAGAKCRYCGLGIPASYPLFEIFCGFLALAMAWLCERLQIGYAGLGVLLVGLPFVVSLAVAVAVHRRFPLKLWAILLILCVLFYLVAV